MKTILALRGAGNRGKSTSLSMLVDKIMAEYPIADLNERRYKIDVTMIITINGVKVGIETQGDPNSRLGASLKRFVESKCKVIVCASRSYGGTVDLINVAASSGYVVKWFDKAKVANPRNHGQANIEVVSELFRAFQIAIDA